MSGRLRFACFAVIVVIFAGCGGPSDRKITGRVVGAWNERHVDREGIVLDTHTVFTPSGVMTSTGSVSLRGESLPFSLSGKWYVKNGYLHVEVRHCTVPELHLWGTRVPIGL
jgi:hypothetical protein